MYRTREQFYDSMTFPTSENRQHFLATLLNISGFPPFMHDLCYMLLLDWTSLLDTHADLRDSKLVNAGGSLAVHAISPTQARLALSCRS